MTSTATQALTALADRTSESLLDDPDALPYIYGAMDHLQARAQAWTDHRSSAFLSSSPPVRQRILAQTAGGEQKLLGKSPREAAKALAGTGGEKQAEKAPVKLEAGGWGEADVGNSELKQKAAWVYEDAFSDAGSEESGEARSLEARKESALRTIEEGLASRKGGGSEEDDGSATESGSDQDGGLGGFAPDEKRQRKKRLARVPEDAGKRDGAGGKGGEGEEQERAWYCFYQVGSNHGGGTGGWGSGQPSSQSSPCHSRSRPFDGSRSLACPKHGLQAVMRGGRPSGVDQVPKSGQHDVTTFRRNEKERNQTFRRRGP